MTARGSGLRRGAFVDGRTDRQNGWVDKRTDNGMVGSRELFSFNSAGESLTSPSLPHRRDRFARSDLDHFLADCR